MKTSNKYLSKSETTQLLTDNSPAGNSTYPKGGVSCSKDSFVVNGSSVLRIKFSGKSPALRVAANRYKQAYKTTLQRMISQLEI